MWSSPDGWTPEKTRGRGAAVAVMRSSDVADHRAIAKHATHAGMNKLARTVLLAVLALGGCNKSPKQEAASAEPSAKVPVAATSADEIPAIAIPPSAPPQPSAIPAPSDVASPPPDAQKTASGLASKVLTKGTGKVHPSGSDRV